MSEAAILTIMTYMDDCLPEPSPSLSQEDFNQRSYSRWAANEIIGLIMDNPFTHPSVVIDEFMINLSCLTCAAKDTDKGLIFSIALDAAEDILSLFLCDQSYI